MDPITLSIIISLASNYFTSFSTPVIIKLFKIVFAKKPELEDGLMSMTSTEDLEHIFKRILDYIDIAELKSKLDIDKSLLEVLREVRFDHKKKLVHIQGITKNAPVFEKSNPNEGNLELPNGRKYSGEFKDGELTEGIMTLPNGLEYSGKFKDGELTKEKHEGAL